MLETSAIVSFMSITLINTQLILDQFVYSYFGWFCRLTKEMTFHLKWLQVLNRTRIFLKKSTMCFLRYDAVLLYDIFYFSHYYPHPREDWSAKRTKPKLLWDAVWQCIKIINWPAKLKPKYDKTIQPMNGKMNGNIIPNWLSIVKTLSALLWNSLAVLD